jgi:DNA-binding LacI/PurR family transcriptional regulator
LCENDIAGAVVVGELARLGLTTPQDVLVVGCDADLPVPGMWSVSPDTGAIAAHAISLLRAMIEDGAPGSRVIHVPEVLDDSGNPILTSFRTAS